MKANMKIGLGVLGVIVLVAAGAYIYEAGKNGGKDKGSAGSGTKKMTSISSFVECEAAGYPIEESYPRRCKTPDGQTFTEDVPDGGSENKTDMIKITTPPEGETVESPLRIEGEARGSWFFEASFPIRIYDQNGNVLGVAVAQAQGDWMTEDFVPFKATLNFEAPAQGEGFIILARDNPSGLAQNDDSIKLPVTFERNNEPQKVSLYLYNPTKDKNKQGGTLCSKNGIEAVEREVTVTTTIIKDALQALIKGGVSVSEKKNGMETMFPYAGLEIKDVALDNDGVLTITFDNYDAVANNNVCHLALSKMQLEKTAMQFKEVESVKILPRTLFP